MYLSLSLSKQMGDGCKGRKGVTDQRRKGQTGVKIRAANGGTEFRAEAKRCWRPKGLSAKGLYRKSGCDTSRYVLNHVVFGPLPNGPCQTALWSPPKTYPAWMRNAAS